MTNDSNDNKVIAYERNESGNSNDGTITSYKVNQETGETFILERTATQFELMTVTKDPSEDFEFGGNLEMGFSGKYFYVLNSIFARIDVFKVKPDGSLIPLPNLEIKDELFKPYVFYGMASF